MNVLDYAARIAVGWFTVSTIGGGAWCIAAARFKARRPVTRVALYPPPVPPVRPRADDLLADAPAEVLAVDELDRQFFAIVDAEPRWFMDGAA